MRPPLEVRRIGRLGEVHRVRADVLTAEPLLREAVALAEAECADDELTLAGALNGLALVCKDVAKYDEARALYQRSFSLAQRASGTSPDDLATLYHNLGGIEHACGNYAAGESFARLAVETRKTGVPADRPELAADMVALAAILDGLQQYDEAEQLYTDALRIFERAPETHASDIAVTLNDLGAQYHRRGLSRRAEALLQHAEALKRRILGPRHPDLAVTLNNLAVLYTRRRDFTRAVPLFAEAVAILEETLGADHPKVVSCRESYIRCTTEASPESP